jgi:hypothetical protein
VLAIADQDGQVLLWSLVDFRFVAELEAESSVLPGLYFYEKRQRLITFSSEGSITA